MNDYRLIDARLTCSCRRSYSRTLALPIDAEGNTPMFDDKFKFMCIVCTAKKCTPRHRVKPTDALAELVRETARKENENGTLSLERLSWNLHVREADARKILVEAGIKFSDDEDSE